MTGLTKERPRSAERPEHDDDPHGTSAASTASEVAAATGRASHLGRAMPIALQFGAMLGIGALLYPAAADWFATLQHDARISGYVEQVAALPDELRIAELDAAHDYNAHLPEGVLRDPYGGEAEAPAEAADDAYLAYQDVLRVDDDGVIGRLSYADLGISLPVYHGTSERVLTNGVGHLYGSSLPVGGPSTHSVLTSHAGLVHAALFTRLPQAEYGDVFQIDVLGETHYYQVDDIRTVLPEETGSLRIVDGEDFVTLITCTPTGINSHRLLVRGARIDAPESASRTSIPGDGRGAGFPWWAVLFVAGSAVTASLLFAPSRRSRSDRAMPAAPAPSASAPDPGTAPHNEGASR